MLPPESYTLKKCLYASSRSEVFSAVRQHDGHPVVLKTYSTDGPNGPSRARREFEALRASRGSGVMEVLDLVEGGRAPILVLERVPGVTLEAWVQAGVPSPVDFATVATQLARALARVHAAHWIHCDVCPRNVMVDPASLETQLIDFGIARTLGASRDREIQQGGGSALGTLRYVAPEQTGRMDRGIDARSDLYSLGATLYFALIGRPPFETGDRLALLHAHLARVPASPCEWRPDLPVVLSRIVLKLLQKEPEDRYQTAAALAHDFARCAEELARTGRIQDDWVLGSADAPLQPRFKNKLYGREREIAVLRDVHSRVRAHGSALAVLYGAPGAGKSALVHELRRLVAEGGGYLLAGKFDLYRRDVPYTGFIAAFDSLVHQILTESEERLTQWREAMRVRLGELAGVLVPLVTDLGVVIGEVAPVPPLPPKEAAARLGLAVQRFMQAAAEIGRGVVLVLDDLQWSDGSSHYLLEELVTVGIGGLLVLGTWRDTEVDAEHPLTELLGRLERSALAISHIHVAPLQTEAAAAMLADALVRPIEQTRRLAELIERKTGSSPLLIQQFVLHLCALGSIRYEAPTGWVWDEAVVAAADIPEGAVGLTVAKLERLGPRERDLIQFASCIGDEFDAALLAELLAKPEAEIEPALFELAEQGLISPSPGGLRFAHDRVREAAQALLSGEERSRLHHRTARLLLARVGFQGLAERIFEIADHLNRGSPHLTEDERRAAVSIDLGAGRRALGSGAAAIASSYLDYGRALFQESDWERDPTGSFDLFWESTEAAIQTQRFDHALDFLSVLDGRSLSGYQRARVTAKRISVIGFRDPERAIDLALTTLRELGVRLSRHPSRWRAILDYMYTNWYLRGPIDERRFALKAGVHPSEFARLIVLQAAAPLFIRVQAPLIGMAAAYMLRFYARRGAPVSPALTLAAYAPGCIELRNDWKTAGRYVRAAQGFLERDPSSAMSLRADFSLQTFSLGWFAPRADSAKRLDKLAERALELGDIEYYTYCVRTHVSFLAVTSQPLAAIGGRLAALRSRAHWPAMRTFLKQHERWLALLQNRQPDTIDWSGELEAVGEALRSDYFWHGALQWMQLLCFFGEYERALVLPTWFPHVSRTHVFWLDFYAIRGVCAFVRAERARGRERRRHRRTARACVRWLHARATHAPDAPFMAQFLQAESARCDGKVAFAMRMYGQAAQQAQERGYWQYAAWIHERRGLWLRAQRREIEARVALQRASELWAEWGARAKVHQLEAELKAPSGERVLVGS